jgi:hypothetical protein
VTEQATGTRPRVIAALYIDAKGPYPVMTSVNAWTEKDDARRYAGPFAVVAHPPCGPWSALKHLHRAKPGEKDCAPLAVLAVRLWVGVLEHPAHSQLWKTMNLPKPGEEDEYGFCIEVQQCDWGHVARKRTWLYCVDVDLMRVKFPPMREPTHWCSGGGTGRGRVPKGIKVCSAQQRRRTPPAFAEWLVALARTVTR